MHFSNVLFYKESENNNHFFQKKLFKKLFSIEVFFLFNTDGTQHVNRVFHAYIHDTNIIIPERQSKHKLIKIILSLIDGVKYEIYLTQGVLKSLVLLDLTQTI